MDYRVGQVLMLGQVTANNPLRDLFMQASELFDIRAKALYAAMRPLP